MTQNAVKSTKKTAGATEDEDLEQPTRPVIYTWENTFRMEPTHKFKPHLVCK